MAHCLSLYRCLRDGADIPKRGRVSRTRTLQAQLFATEGNTDILMMLSEYVCYNKSRKAFKVSPWRHFLETFLGVFLDL